MKQMSQRLQGGASRSSTTSRQPVSRSLLPSAACRRKKGRSRRAPQNNLFGFMAGEFKSPGISTTYFAEAVDRS